MRGSWFFLYVCLCGVGVVFFKFKRTSAGDLVLQGSALKTEMTSLRYAT